MKNKVSIWFLGCFLLLSFNGFSQFFLGGKIGVNMAYLSNQPKIEAFNEYGEVVPKLGLEIGGIATYRFNDYFSIQTEFDYSRKGLKSDLVNYKFRNDTIVNSKWNYTYDYLEIPFLFRVALGTKGFNPFVEFGMYYGYMVYASQSEDTYINNQQLRKETNTGFNGFSKGQSLNRNEYGFKVGIGGAVQVSKGLIFINIRYSQGLTGIIKDAPKGTDTYNHVFQLGVGYVFEIRNNNTDKIYYY